MKSRIFAMLIGLFIGGAVLAQEEARFTIELSSDSILLGNYFEVKFTLENAKGSEFAPPTFSEFFLKGGPNTSTSMRIVNGEVTQKVTYSYYLEPKDIGNFWVEPASIVVGDKVMETQPLEVVVFPNPDGIKQPIPQKQPFNFQMDDFSFPMPKIEAPNEETLPEQKKEEKKKKKKRKTYKI